MKRKAKKGCKKHCYHLPTTTLSTWPPSYHNEATCCHCGRRESEDHGPHHPAKQQASASSSGATWILNNGGAVSSYTVS